MPRIYKPRNPNNTDVRLCPLQSVRQSLQGVSRPEKGCEAGRKYFGIF